MSWVEDTLEAFKTWLGGTPNDAAATRALTVALSAVETYLDRELELEADRLAEAYGVDQIMLLPVWPVTAVQQITLGVAGPLDVTLARLDKRNGVLGLPGVYGQVTVTYTGGFDPIPADLEFALWQVAAALYPGMLSAAGAKIGAAVERVTTPDVGTIQYARAPNGGADSFLGATFSPQIEALLQRYRAESVIGAS